MATRRKMTNAQAAPLRKRAVKMLHEGRTHGEIRRELGVSKSTLSNWLRDVPMTADERERLRQRRQDNTDKNNAALAVRNTTEAAKAYQSRGGVTKQRIHGDQGNLTDEGRRRGGYARWGKLPPEDRKPKGTP